MTFTFQTALNGFDKIICPVNEGGHHWVLVVSFIIERFKKMKSKHGIRGQTLFLTEACILYLFDKWNHSSS